jgi:hypothetical protein
MEIKENPQRSNNFWETIYSPEVDHKYEKWNIADEKNNKVTGIIEVWVQINDIEKMEKGRFKGFKFERTDFIGELEKKHFVFTECQFIQCAFYKCVWKNVKFQKCSFEKTSFSISQFEDCEFRDCHFKEISISSNEMKLINVYIEPFKFISAAYTNLDVNTLREEGVDPEYQAYRLEGTKASVARMLLQMRPIRNNIDTFMEAKHIARRCESFHLIKKGFFDVTKGEDFKTKLKGLVKIPLYFIEYFIIFAIGWLSGWGLKIGRTFLIGFLCTICFSLYYNFFLFKSDSFIGNYLKSLEYWFLFGYTKYSMTNIPFLDQLIIFMNSFLGLFWFATVLPVLLEKMGKDNE